MNQIAEPTHPSGIYLDDCSFAYDLVDALRAAGLRVVTPVEADLLGARDHHHLAYAVEANLALLTRNPRDFPVPPGSRATILAVHQDNIRGKDMSAEEIAQAVTNLFSSGVPIVGLVHVLNHWRY